MKTLPEMKYVRRVYLEKSVIKDHNCKRLSNYISHAFIEGLQIVLLEIKGFSRYYYKDEVKNFNIVEWVIIKGRWMLKDQVIDKEVEEGESAEDTSYILLPNITHCPFCGEKLEAPDEQPS